MNEWGKIVRFLSVGVFNTLAGYALFAAFHYGLQLDYSLANAASYLIMIAAAFLLYEKLVFGKGDGPRLQSVMLYFLSAGIAFLINIGVLNIAVQMGIPVWFAQLMAMGSYSVVFYLCNGFLVFRKVG